MATEASIILDVRNHFTTYIKNLEEPLLQKKEEISALYSDFSKRIRDFYGTEHLAHKVGTNVEKATSRVAKLKLIRTAIYENTELLSYYRICIFPMMNTLNSDTKFMLQTAWLYLTGDNKVIQLLSSNAEKEREASYLLMNANATGESIKQLYQNLKSYADFLDSNLDQLNKAESALRLENNFRENELTNEFLHGAKETGNTGSMEDPIFDELMGIGNESPLPQSDNESVDVY